MIGYIPEKIVYICQEKHDVYRKFDDLDDSTSQKIKVTPAFVSDASNKKTIETGLKWAGQYESKYQKLENGSYGYVTENTGKTIPIVERENVAIKNIQIVNLEHRGNGGRAYKVVTEDNYYFDLREDVLLELMIEVGITKGGIINGEYIWARMNSEMKLVRVDSQLHKVLIEGTKLHNKTKIKSSELVIGGLYKSKTEMGIFLGYGHTLEFKSNYIYSNMNSEDKKNLIMFDNNTNYHYSFNKPAKKEVWLKVWDRDIEELEKGKTFKTFINTDHDPIKVVKSSSFIEFIKEFKIPENIFDIIREKGLRIIEKGINDAKKYSDETNKKLIEQYNKSKEEYEKRNLNKPTDNKFFWNPEPEYPELEIPRTFNGIYYQSHYLHLYKYPEQIQLHEAYKPYLHSFEFNLEQYNQKLK